ncbi:MAG: spermidine/putrescine ABC transporter substrate-binding protein [Chloroflexota bacterium]
MKKPLLSLLLLILLLAACGGGPGGGPAADTEQSSDSSTDANGEVQLAEELSVYNWSDYIDEEMIAQYEETYGVDIIYDTFASNEDLLAKLQAGAEGYDVIFPSDYMVSIMIDLGLLSKIDTADVPNFANIDPQFVGAPFDPNNEYCVPYQWGTTGIGYQKSNAFFQENPPDSWAYVFEPEMLEQYANEGVNVLNDPRELPGSALIYLGYDPNTTNPDELNEARDLILAAKPYWKTFNSEDYDNTLLIPGEVTLTQGWSGDVANAYWNTYDDEAEDGEWYYSIPQEGAVKWLDNICITATTERYETALHFMNYMLDAEVAAAVTNFTYYASPNLAAQEFILPEILEDESIFPPQEVQDKLVWLTEVGEEASFLYDELWTAVKSSQ